MIDKPGIVYCLSDADYHLDPYVTPTLSSSVARALIDKSPRHAWYAHPRLNKNLAADIANEAPTPAQDFGSAVHTILLGAGKPLVEVAADDFRTNAAKAKRDEARAAGKVPLLSKTLARAHDVALAAREQIAGTELAGIFDAGQAEASLFWEDIEGVNCRARVDWLPTAALAGGHIIVPDLKTTGESAAPDAWNRHAYEMGYDVQAEHYTRGLKALIPGVRSVRFPFIVIEQDAPYGLTIFEFGGQAMAEAEGKLDKAMAVWGECLSRDVWPGYPVEPVHIDPPKWRTEQSMMRKLGLQRVYERFFAPHKARPDPA